MRWGQSRRCMIAPPERIYYFIILCTWRRKVYNHRTKRLQITILVAVQREEFDYSKPKRPIFVGSEMNIEALVAITSGLENEDMSV